MKGRVRILFFLILIFPLVNTYGQKEAANWFFGNQAGINFNNNPPTAQTGSLQTLEGSTSISDRNGRLLFYTDGSSVYNRNHKLMPNGTSLKGNISSTQSALIVPKPADKNIYYIFTVDKPDYNRVPEDPIEGINYTVVDMRLNNGLGNVVSGKKNLHLLTYNPNIAIENEFKSSEKISAIISSDCNSYWVVTHFMNRFYSFKVTTEGVQKAPVVSTTPNNAAPLLDQNDVNITALGYLKISPDGKKLAAAFSAYDTNIKNSGKVFLYDFDDITGKVSNEMLIQSNTYPYGIEFSADNSKLYVTSNIYSDTNIILHSNLYQYNLNAGNIVASEFIVNQSKNVAGALQLAINGKIYRAGYPIFTESFDLLSVINQPNELGDSSDYSHNRIKLAPNSSVKLGLPPFIQSLFINTFDYNNVCLGFETIFSISGEETYDSVLWDFGDGNTSSLENASNTYASAGSYTVTLEKFKNGVRLEPVCKPITIAKIYEGPPIFELVQCDTQDDDPMDGITDFNMQDALDFFKKGNTNLTVSLFASLNDAQNGDSEPLSLIFRNTNRDQILFARLEDETTKCFSISEVELKTTESEELTPLPINACDTGNGKADFNIPQIASKIISELNLSNDINLSFYKSEKDAALQEDPLVGLYNSRGRTIFIRANKKASCYGYGTLELVVTKFPDVNSFTEFNYCSSNFPISLSPNIDISIFNDFKYEWNTGETTPSITVSKPGNYSLKIFSSEIQCEKTIEYQINLISGPEVQEVKIENTGATNTVSIITSNKTGNLYAIDNIDGPYQSSNNFRNVSGGPHTLYVKNEAACEIWQKEIMLFGFPLFFTPNNDGYNDLWTPYYSSEKDFQIEAMYIYNRYGKLLKQLTPYGPGWDGTFLGYDMPSDDYWFQVKLKNGQEFKGNFSLLR